MTDDLLISFRSEVPPPKEATAKRIYARATSGHRRALTRRLTVGVAVGVAALATIGFGVSALLQGPRSETPDAVSVPPPSATNLFGPHGKQVTMSQLLADDPSLPLPDSPLANAGNAGTIWESTTGPSATVYYPSSGIELDIVRGTIDTTGTPQSTIQAIDGLTALVYPGVPSASPPVPAQLFLGLASGHVLQLKAFRPAADLVAVAETLTPKP